MSYGYGLADLGHGLYAWMQPDGSWGYSNSGLIADAGQTLLVDTLYDLAHTRRMLDGYARAVPAARRIDTLVNTHANGDHTYGNQLVPGARIVASRACAAEMAERSPAERAAILREWAKHGPMGAWLHDIYGGKFDFEGIENTLPTETFDGTLSMTVGTKAVELVVAGPAHTRGDVLVHVPGDRTVFTGDLLFVDGHPVMWAGPIANWIAACERIIGWDVATVVPGHGPITDVAGVQTFRDYLVWLHAAVRKRYDAGVGVEEAARDIAFEAYTHWLDGERAVLNVASLYREFGATSLPAMGALYGFMHRLRKDLAARAK